MRDNVKDLFEQGKILARAMEDPSIYRQSKNNKFYYDFSGVVAEIDEAKTKGKDSASTTLLLPGEDIPTYRAYGFLIDSEKTDLIHIAERDSGSSGETSKGDFHAYAKSLTSLDALSEQILVEGGKHSMNEVNVCMKDNAYVGVFTNLDKRSIAFGIILQKLNEFQIGKTLPLYMYEKKHGQLTTLDLDIEQKIDIIKECLQNKRLATADIYYQSGKEENYLNILEELEKEKAKLLKKTTLLESALELTEETIRTSTINEQAQTIKTVQRDKQSTRQQEEYKENPEAKTKSNDNPESFRDTLKFNVSSEMRQEIINRHQETELDFAEGKMDKPEKHKIEDTEYGVR